MAFVNTTSIIICSCGLIIECLLFSFNPEEVNRYPEDKKLLSVKLSQEHIFFFLFVLTKCKEQRQLQLSDQQRYRGRELEWAGALMCRVGAHITCILNLIHTTQA